MKAASNSLTVVVSRISLRIIFDDHRRSGAALADCENAGYRENRIRIESYDIGRFGNRWPTWLRINWISGFGTSAGRRPTGRNSASVDLCARGDYRI